MLRKVLRKDLLLNARHFWGMALWLVYVAYVLAHAPQTMGLLAGGSAMMGALLASTIGAREEKLRVSATLASLPVRRRTLVEGRYIVAFLAGAAMYAAVAAAAAFVTGGETGAVFQANTVLVSLALAALFVAVVMPIVIRFGIVGVVVFLAVFQVAGAVLFLLLRYFGMRGASHILGAAERGIQTWHAALARPLPLLATAVVVILAVWLSLRLSVFLAERRDL